MLELLLRDFSVRRTRARTGRLPVTAHVVDVCGHLDRWRFCAFCTSSETMLYVFIFVYAGALFALLRASILAIVVSVAGVPSTGSL